MSGCRWRPPLLQTGRYPDVKSFIQHHASAYPNFAVEYERGADPTLVMKAADGTDETISVAAWNVDTFKEFLSAKLKAA